MFEPNKIYKNTNCLGIVFKVKEVSIVKSEKSANDAFKIKGTWLNQHHDLISIIEDTITVEKQQLKTWIEFKQQDKL